jgi:hypothetical protein
MAGEGKPFPAEEKGAERLFTRFSSLDNFGGQNIDMAFYEPGSPVLREKALIDLQLQK